MSPLLDAAAVASPVVLAAAGWAVSRRYGHAIDRGMAQVNNRRAGSTDARTGGC